MGLLYPFPVSAEEIDFASVKLDESGKTREVTLKTYGLPYLFWGYAAAILTAIFFLWLAIREPLAKLKTYDDAFDLALVYSLDLLIYVTVISLIAFLFYQKTLQRLTNTLIISHRFFGLTFLKRSYTIRLESFKILHHLDSPNVARLRGGEEERGFQNKGYFTLWVETEDKKYIQIDRHSRKADLSALKALLTL